MSENVEPSAIAEPTGRRPFLTFAEIQRKKLEGSLGRSATDDEVAEAIRAFNEKIEAEKAKTRAPKIRAGANGAHPVPKVKGQRFARFGAYEPSDKDGWAKTTAKDAVAVYKLVGGLTPAVWYLLLTTAIRSPPHSGRCTLGAPELAEHLAVSISSVRGALAALRRAGLTGCERDERGHQVLVVYRPGGEMGADTIPERYRRRKPSDGSDPHREVESL